MEILIFALIVIGGAGAILLLLFVLAVLALAIGWLRQIDRDEFNDIHSPDFERYPPGDSSLLDHPDSQREVKEPKYEVEPRGA